MRSDFLVGPPKGLTKPHGAIDQPCIVAVLEYNSDPVDFVSKCDDSTVLGEEVAETFEILTCQIIN